MRRRTACAEGPPSFATIAQAATEEAGEHYFYDPTPAASPANVGRLVVILGGSRGSRTVVPQTILGRSEMSGKRGPPMTSKAARSRSRFPRKGGRKPVDVGANPLLHVNRRRGPANEATLGDLAIGDPEASRCLDTVFDLLLRRAEELARGTE